MRLPGYSALVFVILISAAFGQGSARQPLPPAFREISPGIYELGAIRLDQKARSVRFPASLNMIEGIIEYLLVTDRGSVHESLLTSTITPTELHTAMLLLGAKGASAAAAGGAALAGPIDAEFLKKTPQLTGDAIVVSVTWNDGTAVKNTPVEDWVFNNTTRRPMDRGPWIYNGSRFNDGVFLAQIEGAFAALVTYPPALINNPRPGSDDDATWAVHTSAVPPLKTPVEITLQLLTPSSDKSKP